MHQSEERQGSVSPRVMAATQVDANGSREEPGGQVGPGGAEPERRDGGAKPEEAPERTAKLKAHPTREQTEGSTSRGR